VQRQLGWHPGALDGPQYVIVSTVGGMRSERGERSPWYRTGHWEIGLPH
jgi:xylonate dehydratase